MERKPEGEVLSEQNVLDLDAKRTETLIGKINALAQQAASRMDEHIQLLIATYRQWERENPELAVGPLVKIAMVRLGFVGPGGFDRCHEAGRLPSSALISEDDDTFEDPLNDPDATQVLMCPAMESRRCQAVWQGMHTPPCYLLLLEVHQGLGGGCLDCGVQEAMDDFGRWKGPEEYAESFVRAERLLRRHGA